MGVQLYRFYVFLNESKYDVNNTINKKIFPKIFLKIFPKDKVNL